MKRWVSTAMKDVPATSVDNCVLAEVEGRAEQDPEETRAVIVPTPASRWIRGKRHNWQASPPGASKAMMTHNFPQEVL